MKQMAELLRSGATMLSQSCPECASPLFKLKTGEIWCAKCNRRVVIVPEGEESFVETETQLESIEKALVNKLIFVNEILTQETNTEKMKELAEVMHVLLASLERLRKMRKTQ
jgi:UPF0148 protein